jgi:hypothetical protein
MKGYQAANNQAGATTLCGFGSATGLLLVRFLYCYALYTVVLRQEAIAPVSPRAYFEHCCVNLLP